MHVNALCEWGAGLACPRPWGRSAAHKTMLGIAAPVIPVLRWKQEGQKVMVILCINEVEVSPDYQTVTEEKEEEGKKVFY